MQFIHSSRSISRSARFHFSLLAGLLLGLLIEPVLGQETASHPPCSDHQPPIEGYETSFRAMGTEVHFKAFHRDTAIVAHAFEMAEQRVHKLEAILTDYDPNSETRQLSELAYQNPTTVSDPLWDVLQSSNAWFEASQGAFDASLGRLTQLWRKYRRTTRLPSQAEIEAARKQCGWRNVRLDTDQQKCSFDTPGLRFDFGAIGKGYIVDEAFETLAAHGVTCALVNVSGNMRAGAAPPERAGWKIEIAPLQPGGTPLRHIELADQSIATSGDLWQFVMIDGVRRSHILDPITGTGVSGPRCATAIAPLAIDADALATVACILGFDRAAKLSESFEHMQLLFADRVEDGSGNLSESASVQTTAGFPPDVSTTPATGALHDDRR